MKGFVYVIRDIKTDKFYVGSTNNIKRRIYQHFHNHTQTTRIMKVKEVVLIQEYPNLKMARNIERKIKNLKRKDYIRKMISDGFIKLSN